jgi:hypothetical protein
MYIFLNFKKNRDELLKQANLDRIKREVRLKYIQKKK